MYDRGVLRKDVWDLIFANIRLDIVAEDMRAEIGSCVVGERGIHRILERYGREVFEAHKEYLFDSTEQMMRKEIRSIPEGAYTGESYAYYDGKIPGSKYKILVTITVKDGRITFDYTGTDGQTPGFVNGTYTSSASATILTLLQMVNPDIPHNGGPGPARRHHHPRGHHPERRLPGRHHLRQPPLPQQRRRHHARAGAGHAAAGDRRVERVAVQPDHRSVITGRAKRACTFVDIGFMGLKGGSGAMHGTDGYDHIGMIDASGGVLDQDYEIFEQATPHRVMNHEYWEDSAGAGRWRGGMGTRPPTGPAATSTWSPSATATWSPPTAPRAAVKAR